MNKGQKGFTLWFTGLPCSGKTTIADAAAERLKGMGLKVERLDGDIVRKGLTRGLGFSKEDRDKNIERVTFVAKLLSRNGVATLASFISPYRQERAEARKQIENFIEVFVDCPVEICEQRDTKGMYKKARAGAIKDFTGVNDPYEPPENPEITVHTYKQTVEQSAGIILDALVRMNLVEKKPKEVYTKEEEEKIKERLRNLGYL